VGPGSCRGGKEIAHRWKELIRRSNEKSRDVIGLDPECPSISLKRVERAE
jgi:hypothetical protein